MHDRFMLSYIKLPNQYKDVQEINNIETLNGIKVLLFVTVLQKNKEIYECQEYQTLDEYMETLDMSLVCRQLVQPFKKGLGT